jgi:hypothetical protein
MLQSESTIRTRAAALAEEIAAAVQKGRAVEWLEEVLGAALLDVARSERERCALLADRRAALWEASGRRMSSASWPSEGLVEARERRKEALVLADAIREDAAIIQER